MVKGLGNSFPLPIYADPAQAPQELGYPIYVDGSGAFAEGLYIHMGDGDDYVQFPPETTDQSIDFKVLHGNVYAGSSDFGSLQEAVDFAIVEGWDTVLLPPGTYSGVSFTEASLSLVGVTGFREGAVIDARGEGVPAVDVSNGSGNHSIRNISLWADGSQDALDARGTNNVIVTQCAFFEAGNHALEYGGNDSIVAQCYFNPGNIVNDTIHFNSNSVRCIGSHNTRVGAATSNLGTGNIITDNT